MSIKIEDLSQEALGSVLGGIAVPYYQWYGGRMSANEAAAIGALRTGETIVTPD